MAANPRVVAADTYFTWDGATQRLPRGQVMDVTPDSPLERAIGRHNLVPHGVPASQPAAEPEPQEEAALAKPKAAAKKQDDAGDGGS
jgi:hypothetical protein